MKRDAALVPFSRDHHEALVLARRACEPGRDGAEPALLLPLIAQRWNAHFEPHFAREEQALLPALEPVAPALAARVRSDHARLRALAARLRAGDAAALPPWGEAMREHVQWEERQLFPWIEQHLDLHALRAALERTEDSSCTH